MIETLEQIERVAVVAWFFRGSLSVIGHLSGYLARRIRRTNTVP